ncbi:MAG TPA: tetratricopeptide repeat protein, partial [Acidimicrobiales bacterium]|nr:tetratricopeptide repeat protein [Acidimicrobiales bacterium]
VVGAALLVPLVGTVVGRPGWWRHRAAAVGVVVVGGLVVVALAAETSGTDRTGPSAGRSALVAGGGRDLSTVSNEDMEAVVAANPTVSGMRLALVERYLRAGQLEKARRHAHAALEHATDQAEQQRALKYLGWSTAVLGKPEEGVLLLERSLALAPDDLDNMWFLANVRLVGLDDAAKAIPLLERILRAPIDDQRRQVVEGKLAAARAEAARP